MGEKARKLDRDISHLEDQLEKAREVKDLVGVLEKENGVSVLSRPDSREVVVDVVSEEIRDEMVELQKLSYSNARIEYKHEDDCFTLKAKYRF